MGTLYCLSVQNAASPVVCKLRVVYGALLHSSTQVSLASLAVW